jgi:hypothetical protein
MSADAVFRSHNSQFIEKFHFGVNEKLPLNVKLLLNSVSKLFKSAERRSL